MDEAGLKFGNRGEDLLDKQTDALFEYKIIDNRHMIKVKGKNVENPNFRKPVHKYDKLIKPYHKKSAVINTMRNINQGLYSYMTEFQDFYRNASGKIKKKIILKVSDFRSALIQGKFLAKKGLEIYEFRIESGLNCGGHAFPSN